MNTSPHRLLTGALCVFAFAAGLQAQGTAFTYQGRLNDGANPANGVYDFRFSIYDTAGGGGVVGGPIINSAVAVSNGLFTVTLDFGPGIFTGPERWLEIAVRPGGSVGALANLVPRQKLTPSPYAIQSLNAATAMVASSANSVSAANILGTIASSQLPAGVVTNGASGVNVSGTFAGNALGLSNLLVSALIPATNFSVVAWGNNSSGQTNVPESLNNVTALAAGGSHSLALRSDGTVVAWGENLFNQISIPVGLSNVTAVAAGDVHNLALQSNGAVAVWGGNDGTVFTGAAGLSNVTAIAAGQSLGLALKANGTVFAWGQNQFGQTNVPAGLTGVTAVAAGAFHCLALKADSTVVAWGWNDYGQINVPAGLTNVAAVSAGVYHNLALKTDGTVIAWGFNGNSQTEVPPGLTNVVAVTTGRAYSAALKANGTVAVWGFLGTGQASFAAGLNGVTALGTGGNASHLLVIRGQFATPVAWLTGNNAFSGNISVSGNLQVNGALSGGIDASQLSGGTVPNARLAGTYGNALTLSNAENSFSGNGAGLTSLNAGYLTGAVPLTALPFVPAENLIGTVPDARLSANVALRAGGNTFNGNQTINGQIRLDSADGFSQSSLGNFYVDAPFIVGGRFTVQTGGNVGIGTAFPGQLLQVGDQNRASGSQGMMRFGSHSATAAYSRYWDIGVPKADTDISGKNYSFVIDDPQLGTAPEFMIRWDTGFVGIGTTNPTSALHVIGTVTATAFNPPSDRNLKENFAPVRPREVLDKVASMPISRWNFIGDAATPHVGPMAQDFYSAFGLGTDDKHIATVDADGVALAAIQGLNQKLEEKLSAREARIEALEATVAQLKGLITKLTANNPTQP